MVVFLLVSPWGPIWPLFNLGHTPLTEKQIAIRIFTAFFQQHVEKTMGFIRAIYANDREKKNNIAIRGARSSTYNKLYPQKRHTQFVEDSAEKDSREKDLQGGRKFEYSRPKPHVCVHASISCGTYFD